MSYLLPHLDSGWAVDQAILAEEDRLVVLRFGHDYDPTCMQMDEVLYAIAELVKNYSVIYLVDTTEVPDFNTMYELYDPCTVMFFFRNKVRWTAWRGPGRVTSNAGTALPAAVASAPAAPRLCLRWAISPHSSFTPITRV